MATILTDPDTEFLQNCLPYTKFGHLNPTNLKFQTKLLVWLNAIIVCDMILLHLYIEEANT